MKKRYDFKFNNNEPSDADIKRHMDFDALLNQVPKEASPKSKEAKRVSLLPRMLGGSAVAAALVGVVFMIQTNGGSGAYEEMAAKHFEGDAYINPPIPTATPQLVSYNLNADKGGSLQVGDDTNINVPPSAFRDETGAVIGGNVNIKYRVLDAPGDYFLSGIPMHYDSLGNRYPFETQRVFEIFAEKDGKRLAVNPDKGMEISFDGNQQASADDENPDYYKVYQLKESKENWEFMGHTVSSFIEIPTDTPSGNDEASIDAKFQNSVAQAEAETNNTIANLSNQYPSPRLPQEPQSFDPEKTTFDLDISTDLAEEFGEFKNLRWQPKGDDAKIMQLAKIEWYEDEISLRKVSTDLYKIKFDNGEVRFEMDAVPVLSGPEFRAAMEAYKVKKTAAEQSIQANQVKIAQAKQALEQELNNKKAALQAEKEKQYAALHHQDHSHDGHSSDALVDRAVKHVFTITELGIWNCERIKDADLVEKELKFIDNEGNSIQNTTLYHADLDNGLVQKVFLGEYAKLKFVPSSKNQFWVIMPNGSIANIKAEDVKKQLSTGDNILRLRSSGKIARTEQDVYDELGLGKAM